MRYDESDQFVRIRDGARVTWMASAVTYLWHATVDNRVAVCNSRALVDAARDPWPLDVDRSHSTMTCLRCQELVRRVPTLLKAR